jgi:hypothetical protein
MGIRETAAKVKAAKVFGSGTFLREGRGVLLIDAVKYIDGGFKGDSLVIEMVVESSVDDPTARDEKGAPVLTNPSGSKCSVVWTFNGEHKDTMFGKAKEFLEVLNGNDEEDIAEVLVAACNEDPSAGAVQPCRGMRIKYEAYPTVTKKKQKRITAVRWSAATNDDASIASGINFLNAL